MNGTITRSDEGDIKCEQCPYKASGKHFLDIHTKRMHDKSTIRKHTCQDCGSAFRDKPGLKNHTITAHNAGGIKLKCLRCPYETPLKGNLDRHIRVVHDKILNHVCKDCGCAFSEKRYLKNHTINAHNHGGEKLKCLKCPYKTTSTYNLDAHVRAVHDKIKRHLCKLCGYAFSHASNLRKHINQVHKKIKNHICEECGYAASQKSTLKEHVLSLHNAGKKFVCDQCPYKSSRKTQVARHKRKQHQNRNSGK